MTATCDGVTESVTLRALGATTTSSEPTTTSIAATTSIPGDGGTTTTTAVDGGVLGATLAATADAAGATPVAGTPGYTG